MCNYLKDILNISFGVVIEMINPPYTEGALFPSVVFVFSAFSILFAYVVGCLFSSSVVFFAFILAASFLFCSLVIGVSPIVY